MCPEYIRSSSMPYDAKCDIFSFGIVLMEVVSGCQQGVQGLYLQERYKDEFDRKKDFSADEAFVGESPKEEDNVKRCVEVL